MFVKEMRGFSCGLDKSSRTQCRFRPIIICFVRVTAKPQDESHDYGHGKFETMASFFVGLALVAAAMGIIVSGAVKLASLIICVLAA